MSQIIAETYELSEKIGSGGGGIVYLGRHLRLDKTVVLKADKRSLATKPEKLRREVDALKNLSHTYIPQVYDFVVDGDTVYTVMDYIEGESLDRPLKRGERFPQSQVIEWACQLLEALCYLHSRPPHGILHSDIKPANVMLTPQGDIRLIDFNIALALGEDGSVRVGYSQGYASPEHYGLDFTRTGSRTVPQAEDPDATELVGPTESASTGQVRRTDSSSRSAGGRKVILLDTRSDIYSLGATLYHLLAGVRPAADAREVMPIHVPGVSPAVSAIIQKAMAPNPDDRYQSAQEMLDAFAHLHENDPRAKRHRRRSQVTAAVLILLFLAGGVMTFTGLRQMERAQAEAAEQARLAEEAARLAEEAERIAKQALAAVTSSESAWQSGDAPAAVRFAMEALSLGESQTTRAQKALTDALGVYDLSSGFKSHLLLELPSEALKVVLSPGGTRVGVIVSGQALVFDTENGRQLASLPAEVSALSDIVFSGEDVILYAGEGGLRAYDLARGQELWSGEPATAITLSADGSAAAAVYQDETFAVVYDAATGQERQRVDFEGRHLDVTNNDIAVDPERDLFRLNGDGTLLAVSFAGGGLRVFDLRDRDGDLIFYEESDFASFEGGFCGQYFAFSAKGGELSAVAVFDLAAMQARWGGTSQRAYHLQADESGIYAVQSNFAVSVDMAELAQIEIATTSGDISAFRIDGGNGRVAAATADGVLTFFDKGVRLNGVSTPCGLVSIAGGYAAAGSTDSPALRIFKLESHTEAQVLSYDPDYRHNEARVSQDGSTYMLFRLDQFRIYDREGAVVADVPLPVPEGDRVYDQQYRRDENGSRLEVIYYSGLTRVYSALDGTLLSETMETPPDETLYEEFFTDRLRIERPLHGVPAAYDRETGALVRELEAEDYLTYVTQAGEWIITEYMTSQGERYGLLLNEELETLAKLPGLCDITADGVLLFDDMAGILRQSRIYSLQELMALAEN